MSFGNVMPWWVWAVEHEAFEAFVLGAMPSEWVVEWARSCPKHVVSLRKSYY